MSDRPDPNLHCDGPLFLLFVIGLIALYFLVVCLRP